VPDDQLSVSPWKRYGKDRVNDASGRSLGYLDRATSTVYVADETDRLRVLEALGLDVPEQRLPTEAPYAVTIERFASELAGNRPRASA
jgi:hypothetical protein